MYGRDEMAERLLLEAMAAVDGCLERWRAEHQRLRDHDAFAATGVVGAYSRVLPEASCRDATASMYAEVAHRLGWLKLDRTLSPAEFQRLGADVGGWVGQDRTLAELIDTFGRPSVWIGPTSAEHPKTLAYTTADPHAPLICFHLGQAPPHTTPGQDQPVVVLAVRHRQARFPDAFSFTPAGIGRKPARQRPATPDTTVWIFHGDQERFASGVFTTMAAGLDWAAEHRVTGILAEYAIGGAYDVAVEAGRFRPSKAHHGTPGHVAGFGPGLEHIHLIDGRRD
ncbi:hypothetical protein CLV67_1472 [Actinoplanes italicus]|uniref:DUF7710 domain-containing protein n=2 Tax=Actinoplanes italicus TaxID=113567 RepID=A0A2T0JAP8_9ACTN|nr:hypothetical protein CLV67_1472 [Actinoplanes italicus]